MQTAHQLWLNECLKEAEKTVSWSLNYRCLPNELSMQLKTDQNKIVHDSAINISIRTDQVVQPEQITANEAPPNTSSLQRQHIFWPWELLINQTFSHHILTIFLINF